MNRKENYFGVIGVDIVTNILSFIISGGATLSGFPWGAASSRRKTA
jgi:hypothetical protein